MKDPEPSSVVGASGGRGEQDRDEHRPLRRCGVAGPCRLPRRLVAAERGRLGRRGRGLLPGGRCADPEDADRDQRRPRPWRRRPPRRPRSAARAAHQKPTKKPHHSGGSSGGSHHQPTTLHNNGGSTPAATTTARAVRRHNNPPATHSTHRLDQRAVRPAAGGTEHAGRAPDQAHRRQTPTAAPTTEAPTPDAQPSTDDQTTVDTGADDAETYDTYLTSSEPVQTKTAPVWVVPGILLVLTSMLALLGGVLGRGTRPALAPVKVSNESATEPTESVDQPRLRPGDSPGDVLAAAPRPASRRLVGVGARAGDRGVVHDQPAGAADHRRGGGAGGDGSAPGAAVGGRVQGLRHGRRGDRGDAGALPRPAGRRRRRRSGPGRPARGPAAGLGARAAPARTGDP